MLVIPAIDIIEGCCVRLTRGDFSKKKHYFSDVLKVALKWRDAGAQRLHIIDLDGAKEGMPQNLEKAVLIKEKTGLFVQFGGGIRSMEVLKKVINSGMDFAIIGTSALVHKDFLSQALTSYPGRVILSLDFDQKGNIYKNGWQKESGFNILDFLPGLSSHDLDEVILTNISRDGTLGGSDFGLLNRILEISPVKIIVAGGISDIRELKKLKTLEKKGIKGVIIGKALYEKKIDLAEAIRQI